LMVCTFALPITLILLLFGRWGVPLRGPLCDTPP
jgi:hypothetical protein